jgi:hypothetical protein
MQIDLHRGIASAQMVANIGRRRLPNSSDSQDCLIATRVDLRRERQDRTDNVGKGLPTYARANGRLRSA